MNLNGHTVALKKLADHGEELVELMQELQPLLQDLRTVATTQHRKSSTRDYLSYNLHLKSVFRYILTVILAAIIAALAFYYVPVFLPGSHTINNSITIPNEPNSIAPK